MSGGRVGSVGILFCIVVSLLALRSPLQAGTTDVIVLDNGNRLTGEVKELRQGRLRFKTTAMGTVYVEWDHVAMVSSDQYLEFQTTTGLRVYGNPAPGEHVGELKLVMYVWGTESEAVLAMAEVIGITPIHRDFGQRLDGSFDLGVTATQSNSLRQFSAGLTTSIRSKRFLGTLLANSLFSRQTGAENVNRHSMGLSGIRFFGKNFLAGFGQAQTNDELELDLRLLVGATGGRFLIRTNRSLLGLSGGLSVSEEEYRDLAGFERNVEGVLAMRYEYFTYDTPKTNAAVDLLVFPSLTTSGRYRIEFDASVRHELVKDFFLGVNLLDSFDSDPPVAGAVENDWSLVTSLGYSW